MKRLMIPRLSQVSHGSPLADIDAALTSLPANTLAEVPWADYPYKPSVDFKIAHTSNSILLKYNVKERHIKAAYRNTNDPVYKDSCVEFFLSFDDTHYYNLEFNCMGTGLIGYGDADKDGRQRLPVNTVEQVKTYSSINALSSLDMGAEWHLLLDIPFTVFEAHAIVSLADVRCTGNFYKCGDELPTPHFVCWSAIDHPSPNFHLPQFFGILCFV